MFDRQPEFVPAEEAGCDTAKAMTIFGIIVAIAAFLYWSAS